MPSGWDSWGKIKVLREGFDCDHVSEGWDADMDAVIDRQKPGNTGARGTYEEAIPNGESEIQVRHPIALFAYRVLLTLYYRHSLNTIYLPQPFVKTSSRSMTVIMRNYKRARTPSRAA